MRLTKTACDAAKYPYGDGRRFVLWDDDVSGFGLRVYPSGRRAFIFSYRINGRKRLMTLGDYGPLTVQAARKRALKARAQVSDGIDPREAERQRQARATTVSDLADDYMSEVRRKRKPGTVRAYESLLRANVNPTFGKMLASAITEDDVQRWHRGMRDTPYAANRALWLLSRLMKIAARRGIIDGNPCASVTRYRERERNRPLSGAELAAFGDALRKLEGDGAFVESEQRVCTVSPHAAGALRLLVLTGGRLREILTLRWDQVDLERNVAILEEHKADSSGKPRVLLLPAPAIAVLESLPRTEGNPYVIEGQVKDSHLTDLSAPWRYVCEVADIEGARLHDLRHTVGTWAAEGNASLLLVAKVLGHRQVSTTERYAKPGDDPVRQVAERTGKAIAAAMEGNSADVVRLQRGLNDD